MPAIGEGARGFTLFEMLVVLAILGLIAGIVYPALGRGARGQALASATAAAASALREARGAALRHGRPVRVELGGAGIRVGDRTVPLPSPVTGAIAPATGLLFLPDGSSGGGSMTLAAGDRMRRLWVAPATGHLSEADR